MCVFGSCTQRLKVENPSLEDEKMGNGSGYVDESASASLTINAS